jgi:hypothetical protein
LALLANIKIRPNFIKLFYSVFDEKIEAYPRGAPIKIPLAGRLLALLLSTNIRLSWKGLPGTNTIAYYEHS